MGVSLWSEGCYYDAGGKFYKQSLFLSRIWCHEFILLLNLSTYLYSFRIRL